jgi:hypothetical protein
MAKPDIQVGKATLRLRPIAGGYKGIVIVGGQIKHTEEGPDESLVVQRLHDAANRLNPSFFGYEVAIKRFHRFYPNGFHSAGFDNERGYKLKAKARLDASVPLDSVAKGSGFAEAIAPVFQATNMLFKVEKAKLMDALRSPAADAFVRGAAKFTLGDTAQGLADMVHALKPFDSAKWTVITYLPYLWRPDAHMFLKPTVTKDFAERVGHRFANDYSAELKAGVYESLLDLVSETRTHIADLKPRDHIDVQSFVWVVGDYDETIAARE